MAIYTPDDVNGWFQAVQFRNGPTATVASYVSLLNSGSITPASAQLAIINDTYTSSYVNPVVRLYQAAYNRVPDAGGQNFWVDQLAAGTATTQTVANQFASSSEFISTYGNVGGASAPINEAILTALYENVLNRVPDQGGFTFWLNAGFNVGQVLNFFAQSAEFTQDSGNAVLLFQQAEIAGIAAGTGSLFQYGGYPAASAVLTTGVDILNLTQNTAVTGVFDTEAPVGGVLNSTFQAFDSITGADGTNNTLAVTVIGNSAKILPSADVSGVQTINTRAVLDTNTTVTTVNAANFVGATSFNSDRSTSALKVDFLAEGQAVGIIGNGSTITEELDAVYVGATTATLNLSGGVKSKAIDFTTGTAALTTLNINSSGGVNSVVLGGILADATVNTVNIVADTALSLGLGLDVTATTSVNVSGGASNLNATTAAVNLGAIAIDADINAVDASNLENGGISAALNAGNTTITVKGGQGNDFITTGNTALTTGSVDAQAGTADLLIANNAAVATASLAAKYANFEVLRVANAGNVDVSGFTKSAIGSIQLGASGAGATGLTAAQAVNITNLVDNTAGTTLALKTATGTSDVLTVNLSNATATSSADLTGLTINGFETFNVVSNTGGFGANTNALSFTAANTLTSLNLTGSAPISVAQTNLTSKAITIDGSALTATGDGNTLEITNGSVSLLKGSSVIGSAFRDSITTSAVVAGTSGDFVTYDAGAGNDVIVSTVAAINNTNNGFASLKINGGLGTDTLSTDAATTYVDATFQYITNVEAIVFGEGALTATTGGFFNTNFSKNGVTVSQTFGTIAAGAGATSNVDASTFTGAVTAVFDEIGGGKATNAVILRTGSAADEVAVTTNSALTSTTNTIQTGEGSDSVTLDLAALNAAGKFTVNLGAGGDTINANYAGAGLLDLTAGSGADTINYSATHTGVFNANQATGASGSFTAPAANVISTVTYDVFTGTINTDTITLSSITGASYNTTINTGNNLSTATYANETVTAVLGVYDATAGTFTGSATGTDLFVVYDSTTGAATTLEAVVLVGQAALTSVTNAGVITV